MRLVHLPQLRWHLAKPLVELLREKPSWQLWECPARCIVSSRMFELLYRHVRGVVEEYVASLFLCQCLPTRCPPIQRRLEDFQRGAQRIILKRRFGRAARSSATQRPRAGLALARRCSPSFVEAPRPSATLGKPSEQSTHPCYRVFSARNGRACWHGKQARSSCAPSANPQQVKSSSSLYIVVGYGRLRRECEDV
mmetsp:Transcript_29276/g.89660  ORF Transcript_29276/g.89660 Transcript_29276/m.89660 type:complete len:195 (+) Transcript_29276:1010-1594(+)